MNLINTKSAYNNENENNNFSHVESTYEAKVVTMPNGQGEDTTTFSMTTMCTIDGEVVSPTAFGENPSTTTVTEFDGEYIELGGTTNVPTTTEADGEYIEPGGTTNNPTTTETDGEYIEPGGTTNDPTTTGADGEHIEQSGGTDSATTTTGPADGEMVTPIEPDDGVSTTTTTTTVYPSAPENILITSIRFLDDALRLGTGDTQALVEEILPANATNRHLRYTSSNPSVATVDPDSGLVTAISEGEATITAHAQDGSEKTATCAVTVFLRIPVTSIEISTDAQQLLVGDTCQLTVKVYPENATNKQFRWTLNDESLVAVSVPSGILEAKKIGVVIITVTTVDGGYQDRCEIKIGEIFDYTSSVYDNSLALKCAEYSMLAYESIQESNGVYIDSDENTDHDKALSLNLLVQKLEQDNFSNVEHFNYDDEDEENVSYTLASKQVLHYHSERTLLAIVIRGTHNVEWKGNMDVTGSTYNSMMDNHYNFDVAATDLLNNPSQGLLNYINLHGITNPLYLITGHSRGAAVANLVANTLSTEEGVHNVYAYTFATPNNTKTKNTTRMNIFNFCFDDDFVPQVPLTQWGYEKHGITYTKNADSLYKHYQSFKNDMDRFMSDSRGRDEVIFSSPHTSELLDYVSQNWPTIEDYYEKEILIRDTPIDKETETLYHFFRTKVAPAAMGNLLGGGIDLLTSMISGNTLFSPIASFFVTGSNVSLCNDYIYSTHAAFTYYTAVKYDLFR